MAPSAQAQWADDFESYTAGTGIEGQGGWKNWGGGTTGWSLVDGSTSYTGSNSVQINGGADTVHEYTGVTSGAWVFTSYMFIPLAGAQGKFYFILLNDYNDPGPFEWSVQLGFDMDTGFLACDCGSGSPLNSPIAWDTWTELRVEFDLDNDTIDLYYGGILQASYLWSEGPFGSSSYPSLQLDALDLYPAGGTVSPVFFDDFTLTQASSGDCPTFCVSNLNSTGSAAMISSTDACNTDGVDDNTISLSASPVPNQPGIFFHGTSMLDVPFGCGHLCTAGTITRGGVVFGSGNTATYDFDTTGAGGSGLGNYQYWFRDPAHAGTCGNTFNTSDALTY